MGEIILWILFVLGILWLGTVIYLDYKYPSSNGGWTSDAISSEESKPRTSGNGW